MSHRKNRRYHRVATEQQLLDDLRAVARKLDRQSIRMIDYFQHGEFNIKTIYRHLGGWNRALKAAGLNIGKHYRVTAPELIADLKRVAKELGTDRFTQERYYQLGGHSERTIINHFKSWQDALAAAGLKPSQYRPNKKELMQNLCEMFQKLGRVPRTEDMFRPQSRYTVTPYVTHFGSLRIALHTMVDPRTKFGPTPDRMKKVKLRRSTFRRASDKQRYEVLARDGFRCRACGRSPATEAGVRLEIDHVHPWSRGGKTVSANLQTLCHECNKGKSNSVGTNDEVGTMNDEVNSTDSEANEPRAGGTNPLTA